MELPLKASDVKNQIKAANAKRRVVVLFRLFFFFCSTICDPLARLAGAAVVCGFLFYTLC